jgi:hypothetical protein
VEPPLEPALQVPDPSTLFAPPLILHQLRGPMPVRAPVAPASRPPRRHVNTAALQRYLSAKKLIRPLTATRRRASPMRAGVRRRWRLRRRQRIHHAFSRHRRHSLSPALNALAGFLFPHRAQRFRL